MCLYILKVEENSIQRKLKSFITKYYTIKIVQGSIIFISILLLIFLVLSFIEYYFYTSEKVRFIFLFTFIFINVLVALFLIIIPLLKQLKLLKQITYADAAKIIGLHFAEIKDNLLNLLQLSDTNISPVQLQLLTAAIEEKTAHLRPLKFNIAIKFNIKKYKYYIFIFILGLLIILFNPNAVTQSSYRILHYNQLFSKPLPYQISIENTSLQTVQNEDFKLKLKIIGDIVPEKIYVTTKNQQFQCLQLSKSKFEYVFKNVNQNINFQIQTGDYTSSEYQIQVIAKPVIYYQTITIQYPAYLQRKTEVLENVGDIIIPAGSEVIWNFKAQHSDNLFIQIDSAYFKTEYKHNQFNYNKKFYKSAFYKVFSNSPNSISSDTLSYRIDVVPDAFPQIMVEEFKDSNVLFNSSLFYKGIIEDDYGFKQLQFFFAIDTLTNNNKQTVFQTIDIPINKTLIKQDFYHEIALTNFKLQAGQSLSCYFTICDNDVNNNFKCSQSQLFIYKIPTINEIQKQLHSQNKDVKDNMQQAINKVQKELTNLKNIEKDILAKNNVGWQEKKKIEDVINNLQNLQNEIKDINQQYEEAKQNADFINENQEIIDKYNQLQELFEKTFNDEIKQLLQQYQELLDKMDKNKFQETLQQLKFSATDIKNELDRNLNLFKQLELQQNLQAQINELLRLSEMEQKLAEQNLDKNNKQDQIQQQQQIDKDFQEVKKQLDQIQKDNKALEEPMPLQNFDKQMQNIQQEINDAKQQTQSGNKKQAKNAQQQAADDMNKLAEEMQDNLEEMQQEEYAEDIATLRQILDNLVTVSFKQEELINNTKKISITDPKYVQHIQNQKNLNSEIQMIQDSLIALSKRQVEIKNVVLKEIEQINYNSEQTLLFLVNRQKNPAGTRQQFVMTHINNLALMLAEALKSLKENQQNSSSCSSSGKSKMKCKNPGKGGKPSVSTMRQMQKQLNDQISKLQQQMQDAKSKGQGIGKQFNEQLAKLAAQQEALRKQINELSNQLKGEGNTQIGKELDKLGNEMELTETELINKMLNLQTLKRQQDIITKMLESEKALNEREQEERRESTEGKDLSKTNASKYEEFFKLQKKSNQDILNKYLPSVNPYYKEKIKQYLYHF